MSVDYNAYVVVGLDYDKLKLSPAYFDPDSQDDSEEDFEEWLEEMQNEEISRYAPYYDAASEECFYGIQCDVDDKTPEQVSAIIQIAMKQFKNITGLVGEVSVTLNVY